MMMKVYYDWEFHEDGSTIDPISLGACTEYGDEFYAINAEADWRRVSNHPWLPDNVLPHLPGSWQPDSALGRRLWLPDTSHRSVMSRVELAQGFLDWIGRAFNSLTRGPEDTKDEIELNGWYSGYDHVCLMWLWGPMVSSPSILPHYTRDLRQEYVRLQRATGVAPEKPEQSDAHHALADAKWNRTLDTVMWAHELRSRA